MSKVGNNTHVVQAGECAWKYAKSSLQTKGQKVSNQQIVAEMRRLAKLNNCKSVEDFNEKFFSKAGSEFISGNSESVQTDKKTVAKQPDVKQDTTKQARAKTPIVKQNTTRHTQVNQTFKQDTLKQDTTLANDATRVNINKPVATSAKIAKKKVVKLPASMEKAREVREINNLPTDTARIIEYNKKNYDHNYYGIVDKKSCQLKIYNKQGKVVKTFTVGIGKNKGDQLGSYYLDRAQKTKDAYKAEQGRYTTAGEFTLDEQKKTTSSYTGKDGKPKVMSLKGDNKGERAGQMSIHMLYKPAYAKRKAAIDSKNLEDNRMSYGCVNLKEEDYDAMHAYLGEGQKIYILPEEKGNKLLLEKQKDGSYKFEQQYHKNQKRSVSKEAASKVVYDVRPQNNPKYIAQQKQKKADQAKQLAQQQQQQKEEFSLFKPSTWFS